MTRLRSLVAVTVVATFALVAAGVAIGSRVLLPLLEGIPAWLLMARLLTARRRADAVVVMMVWGLSLGAALTLFSYAFHDRAGGAIWHGPEYAREMVTWVETGEGSESRPRLFIPQHARHFALYATLCLLSGSLLGIVMGAALMGYMSHYVATLALMSHRPLATAALGWHFWSVVRVAAFILLGVVFAEPLLSRVARYDPRYGRRGILLAFGASGIVLDVLLKTIGAEPLRHVLQRLVSGG